jgi:hypothetical protein
MKNRTPVARESRPPLPDFAPVPRKHVRHDGWTPERQRAFIEALADTGSVSTACRMVNMASEGAYALRRQPGAEAFRRAWEAALDMGVQRLKDEAFERAMNGQLVPVFVGGKLLGYRRKKNDRLLMFCLRHYGQDAQGKRVTINYFSNKATAGAGAATSLPLPPAGEGRGEGQSGEDRTLPTALPAPEIAGQALAQSSTTTLRTTLTQPSRPAIAERDDTAAAVIESFQGADLDPQAQAEILAALTACADRQRALSLEDDPDVAFIAADDADGTYVGDFESGTTQAEPPAFLPPGERPWHMLGDEAANAAIDAAVASVEAHKALPEAERLAKEAEWTAEAERQRRRNNFYPGRYDAADGAAAEADEARMDWREWED